MKGIKRWLENKDKLNSSGFKVLLKVTEQVQRLVSHLQTVREYTQTLKIDDQDRKTTTLNTYRTQLSTIIKNFNLPNTTLLRESDELGLSTKSQVYIDIAKALEDMPGKELKGLENDATELVKTIDRYLKSVLKVESSLLAIEKRSSEYFSDENNNFTNKKAA